MSDQHAQPGDIIEITTGNSDLKGKRVAVVECPSEFRKNSYPGEAWIHERAYATHLSPKSYTIIKRANSRVTQNDDVDKSLARQRDDNLRSLFGYD